VKRSEDELIAAARSGDQEAFAELVRHHQERVWRTAVRLVGPDDADDIAQEVFIKAHASLHTFRGHAALSTWLYRMAINLSLNQLRGARRERHRRERYGPGVSEPAERPDRQVLRSELEAQVWKAIDALPDRQRTALVLHRFEDLSAREVAEIMQLSTGAVESLLHRARLSLFDALSETDFAPGGPPAKKGTSGARNKTLPESK
jgi:RNA polymerase sigma factor (sigma-70 family)